MNDSSKIHGSYPLAGHIEGESRQLAAPVHLITLKDEDEELRRGSHWRDGGQEAKTLVRLPNLRVVLVSLKAGISMKPHRTDAEITIHLISGHARVRLQDEAVELRAGQILILDRSISHDLEAVEDSAALLTIAWTPGAKAPAVP